LSVVGGQILGFSIDSRCRPYNTLALPCECVILLTRDLFTIAKFLLYFLKFYHVRQDWYFRVSCW